MKDTPLRIARFSDGDPISVSAPLALTETFSVSELLHITGRPAPYTGLATKSARHRNGLSLHSQVVGSARVCDPDPPNAGSRLRSYTLRPRIRALKSSAPSKAAIGIEMTL